jgi:hypothetical protein
MGGMWYAVCLGVCRVDAVALGVCMSCVGAVCATFVSGVGSSGDVPTCVSWYPGGTMWVVCVLARGHVMWFEHRAHGRVFVVCVACAYAGGVLEHEWRCSCRAWCTLWCALGAHERWVLGVPVHWTCVSCLLHSWFEVVLGFRFPRGGTGRGKTGADGAVGNDDYEIVGYVCEGGDHR